MEGHIKRQPRRDAALLGRPADAHSRYRYDFCRQIQHVTYYSGVIPDHADGAAAETGGFGRVQERCHDDSGVDRCIEEKIEMIVRERLASQARDFGKPAAVGEKDEKHRGVTHPWHLREQAGDRIALCRVTDHKNIALLQVAL